MNTENSSEGDVLGDVEVDGIAYVIHKAAGNQREVVRRSDGRRVGTLRGSPSLGWRLEAEEGDGSLLRAIVRAAMQEGLLVDLPTD